MRATQVDREDRFDALFHAHAARLVRLARLLGDGDPEDVVQESFCKLYAARGRLQARRGQGGGLPQPDRGQRGPQPAPPPQRGPSRRPPARRGRLPGTRWRRTATGRPCSQGVAGLPQRQREALVLRYWMDLPLAAIAEAMGVRVGTVKSQMSRGLDVSAARCRRGGGAMSVEERLARALHEEADRIDVDVPRLHAAHARPAPRGLPRRRATLAPGAGRRPSLLRGRSGWRSPSASDVGERDRPRLRRPTTGAGWTRCSAVRRQVTVDEAGTRKDDSFLPDVDEGPAGAAPAASVLPATPTPGTAARRRCGSATRRQPGQHRGVSRGAATAGDLDETTKCAAGDGGILVPDAEPAAARGP